MISKLKQKTIVITCTTLVVLLIVVLMVVTILNKNNDENETDEHPETKYESQVESKNWYEESQVNTEEDTENIFTIDLVGKEPGEITWEEYMEFSEEEQILFPDYFDSYDEFSQWYEENRDDVNIVDNIEDVFTIDLNGKEPEEITWEEYMKFSEEEQALFPDYFDSYDEFSQWYEENSVGVVENTEDMFTIDLNGKEPEEITWEEYMKFSKEDQAMFPDYFDSYDDFMRWMENNKI